MKENEDQGVNDVEMDNENGNDEDYEDVGSKRRGRPSGSSHVLTPVKKATLVRAKGKGYIRNTTKLAEGILSKINASKVSSGSGITANTLAVTEANKNVIQLL